MNIMLFSRILAKTGVGNHVNDLSKELARQGHKVVVVSGTNEQNVGDGVHAFERLNTLSRNPYVMWKSIRRLHGLIKQYDIQVVHCHHRVAALFMKLHNMFYRHVPVVYSLHLAPIPADFIHRSLTFVGDRAIGVSSLVSEFLISGLKVHKEKVRTVLNGVDESTLAPLTAQEKAQTKQQFDVPEGRFVFALHSRIDAVKNHLLVVEAVHGLTPELRQKIIVVCSGQQEGEYYQKLCAQIKAYGLEDQFRFVGWCQTRKVLGIADCLLLPSWKEGFALSVPEAFLLRVPVARTRTAGFEDQKYCIPIRADHPEDVIDVISNICSGRWKEKVCVEEAFQYAQQTMTVSAMAKNTVKVYEEVCLV